MFGTNLLNNASLHMFYKIITQYALNNSDGLYVYILEK